MPDLDIKQAIKVVRQETLDGLQDGRLQNSERALITVDTLQELASKEKPARKVGRGGRPQGRRSGPGKGAGGDASRLDAHPDAERRLPGPQPSAGAAPQQKTP